MKKVRFVLVMLVSLILLYLIDSKFIENEYVYQVPNTRISIKVITNASKKSALVFWSDSDFVEIKTTKCSDVGTTYFVDTLANKIICLENLDNIKGIYSHLWRIEKFDWRTSIQKYDTNMIYSAIISQLNGNFLCVYSSDNVLYWYYYDKKIQDRVEMKLVEKRRKLIF